MIFCKELNKEFATKEELLAALKANKDTIVAVKKAAIKDSDPVLYFIKNTDTQKDVQDDAEIKIGDFIYPVINTTNYLDSHGDVHIDGIWDLSIKDQTGKLYYAVEHQLQIGMIISYPSEVTAYVKTMQWSELGKSYSGTTQALIFKAQLTNKTNKDAFEAIIAKEAIQNSVRMMYVDYILCIDDTSPEYAEENANFYKYFPNIANKDVAIQRGYYWAVLQAKIFKEGSAVLAGSNDATMILYTDPLDDSQSSKEKKEISPVEASLTLESIKNFKFI